jgi:phosphoribosylamine--glycine ligase
MNILLIGSGAREHAIAKSVKSSDQSSNLFCLSNFINPGIQALCQHYILGNTSDLKLIQESAKKHAIDYAIIGPEAPLADGVADCLKTLNIPSFGPTKALARVETSKLFARDLLKEAGIKQIPLYQSFNDHEGMDNFIDQCSGHYVMKADGLMSGKGVKVSGEHLHSKQDAHTFADFIFSKDQTFVMEEKLNGIEFSLFSLTDGKTVKHFPLVQDHKRAFDGDEGPNTGGMGSYSCADGKLPFLDDEDITTAQNLNEKTLELLQQKTGETYQGILYGGYMLTSKGVMNIEYNARFGDPEAMNLLSLITTDFIDIIKALKNKTLDQCDINFKPLASVCVYAVPNGYPDKSEKGLVSIPESADQSCLFIGGVSLNKNNHWQMTGSRTLAVCYADNNLESARNKALNTLATIKGPVFYRKDIASQESIDKKITLAKNL